MMHHRHDSILSLRPACWSVPDMYFLSLALEDHGGLLEHLLEGLLHHLPVVLVVGGGAVAERPPERRLLEVLLRPARVDTEEVWGTATARPSRNGLGSTG